MGGEEGALPLASIRHVSVNRPPFLAAGRETAGIHKYWCSNPFSIVLENDKYLLYYRAQKIQIVHKNANNSEIYKTFQICKSSLGFPRSLLTLYACVLWPDITRQLKTEQRTLKDGWCNKSATALGYFVLIVCN